MIHMRVSPRTFRRWDLDFKHDTASHHGDTKVVAGPFHVRQPSMDHQQLPDNEAARSAVQVSSDHELRVACYCEENVYRLVCRKLKQNTHNADGDNYYVMFVSSESLCVPMYYQRAAARPTAPCLWDYHVLVLHADPQQQQASILDVDSLLPYPTPLHDYATQTFPGGTIHRDYAPLFRVIRASAFLKNFYSDRMHMFSEGKWSAPPPSYACIQTNKGSNLDSYRIMTWDGEELDDSMFDRPYGAVLNREQLMHRFGNAREAEIKK